jgi:hypothetical protein
VRAADAGGTNTIVVGVDGSPGSTHALVWAVLCPSGFLPGRRRPARRDAGSDARRIVVGVDGSATAHRALRWAVREAAARDVPLDVVSAWHLPYLDGSLFTLLDGGVFEAGARATIDTALADVDCSAMRQTMLGSPATTAPLLPSSPAPRTRTWLSSAHAGAAGSPDCCSAR